MGYNRRAINLHRAARLVVEDLAGAFPRDLEGLQRLPGVGPYTARAVASIAYRLPVGAVDTNVRRVLGRVLAGDPAGLPARELQAAADALVDPDQPDDWTHALMDIGSTLCRPARPLCAECPLASFCRYAAGDRPAGGPRGSAPHRARSSPPAAGFQATTRWLRGRILDRLREAPDEAWVSFAEPIGGHGLAAIGTSLRAMEGDGLLELEGGGPLPADAITGAIPRARLPIA